MGTRGPIPKRSDQRRRENKPEIPIDTAPAAEDVQIPLPGAHWVPPVAYWYCSLAESGQSCFYEPSDWATAWIWAEMLDRAFSQGMHVNSQLVTAWAAGASELLTTEGARRRLRIELAKAVQSDPDADSAVTALDDFRSRFAQ